MKRCNFTKEIVGLCEHVRRYAPGFLSDFGAATFLSALHHHPSMRITHSYDIF
ncbi:Protein of unknown function [Pyronema omphalodes CBS 100304]|uniref:Uncharacterized protein n=1 Tax=Pyronema omphalodes (strain CBS 100304) TaxID=1076935 RepID=U4LN48_PYROM|nr:Protein of unknown function [Pyronema omphalodes CBS 100304]